MTDDRPAKVFGIGLNKTGTTTLGECGKLLGYRTTGADRALLEDVVLRSEFSRVVERVEQFDLFQDGPYPLIYPELDRRFPGSKFVLTVRRSVTVWLDYPHRHEQEHLAFYRQHNDAAHAYFAGRGNDFIEICWETGDDLTTLCTFLGKPVPDAPLPHANRGRNREQRVRKSRYLLNRLLLLARY